MNQGRQHRPPYVLFGPSRPPRIRGLPDVQALAEAVWLLCYGPDPFVRRSDLTSSFPKAAPATSTGWSRHFQLMGA